MSIKGGIEKWNEKFPTAIKFALCYWPFVVSILYFGLVPIRYGNLLMDSFGFCWAVFLSWIANQNNLNKK